ncbi:hypothetical protein PFISCL1PPCAC_3563, partial [Pristionchus fissidentatus]
NAKEAVTPERMHVLHLNGYIAFWAPVPGIRITTAFLLLIAPTTMFVLFRIRRQLMGKISDMASTSRSHHVNLAKMTSLMALVSPLINMAFLRPYRRALTHAAISLRNRNPANTPSYQITPKSNSLRKTQKS